MLAYIPIKSQNIKLDVEQNKDENIENIAKSFHNTEQTFFGSTKIDENKQVQINYDATNFGSVKEEESNEFKKNIIEDSNNILFKYDDKNNEFYFFDNNQNSIGNLRVLCLMKYIATPHDINKQFIKYLEGEEYNRNVDLIEKIIGKNVLDDTTNKYQFKLFDYKNSPIMGDLEILLKLNHYVLDFFDGRLDRELTFVDSKYRNKITDSIEYFIYNLLNYTLLIISIASEKLVHRPDKTELKEKLIKYSIGAVYKISKYVQKKIEQMEIKNINIKKILITNNKLQEILVKKTEEISNELKTQNRYLMNQIELAQIGGDVSTPESDVPTSDSNLKYISSNSESHFSAIYDI